MTDPPLLTWIKKSDGRLLPFDPDRISRDLFAATQRLGAADAFLARELTDGVVHFLAADAENGTITTVQVSDTVAKVVRELGHTALAQTFLLLQAAEPAAGPIQKPFLDWDQVNRLVEAAPPACALAWQLSRACLHAYSLQKVFGADLVAAHEASLLTLNNLDTPLELAGLALTLSDDQTVESVAEARNLAGQVVAIDGPDHVLTQTDGNPATFARRLSAGLRSTGLRAVVNLNCALPPSRVGKVADGPLFAERQHGQSAPMAERLAEELLQVEADARSLRVDWHLEAGDFRAEAGNRMLGLVRRALDGVPLTFVMDRANRPVALADGLDRRHPALLMTVGLHLPALADQSTVKRNPVIFLQKLGSLARMALSAGVQKREFLRKHIANRPSLSQGFLLDRASLVVVPLGLDAAVQSMLGQSVSCGNAEPLDFARRALEQLREALQRDGRSRHLESCLDRPLRGRESGTPAAPPQAQLQAADALHTRNATGTVDIILPQDVLAAAVVDLLRHAWHKTEIIRVRLLHRQAEQAS
jgi:hypothetical protein